MSLTIPTASSIKMRFPEFADVDDLQAEFAIEEAREEFGDGSNWTGSANLALIYLSAHYISCGIDNAASGGSGSSGDIASESIGRLSISYKQDNTAVTPTTSVGDKTSTSYGKRYLDMVQANFSGAGIV